jgi:hypothetical protein
VILLCSSYLVSDGFLVNVVEVPFLHLKSVKTSLVLVPGIAAVGTGKLGLVLQKLAADAEGRRNND